MERCTLVLGFVLLSTTILTVYGTPDPEDAHYRPHKKMERPKPDGKWKEKDVRDYSDMDVENLYDQWEEGDEEIPVDELPAWELEPPPIDMRKINLRDSDSILAHSKKYRTLMMFATLVGSPNHKETEKESSLWESSLYNAGIQVKRYVIEPGKVLFQMDDGGNSVQIRNFLLEQENCWEVNLDSKTYDGKAKKVQDKFKPLTKEEAKAKKEEEAKKQEEREQRKKEREEKKKNEDKKKNKDKNQKKGDKKKKDEL